MPQYIVDNTDDEFSQASLISYPDFDFVFNGLARQIRLVGLHGVLVSRKHHEKDKLSSTSRALLAKDLGDEIKAVGEGRRTVCELRPP